MADIDDELLALVGGDDNSGDESDAPMDESRSASESPEPAPKAKKGTTVKKTKKRRDDSEEEEGEASSNPSSPASQQSAPMDESDSDVEFGQPSNSKVYDDDNKYPVEGMFVSEAERREIMAMREVEREQILAERAQEVERQRQNRLLRQLVTNQENEEKKQKKRKAGAAELEDAQRKTSRQRTKVGGTKVGETASGIDTLRRARAEKSDRLRRREEDREKQKDRRISFDRDSADHSDHDSDVEWSTSRRRPSRSRTPERREAAPAELRDVERIRVGRSRFADYCFYPGFENAMTGCYVRISLGPDREGVAVYRMGVIKGFTKGRPYAIEKRGGSIVTDQYVRAAHGKSEREWPFISCSDSPFTETEFNRLRAVCQEEGVNFPKKPYLVSKIEEINTLVNRTWTDTEVQEKITRQRVLKERFMPSERGQLQTQIEEAKRRGNETRVAELQQQLENLGEAPKLAWKTSLTPTKKPATSNVSQQDRLAQINAENRRKNVEAVRKAQLKEKARAKDIEQRLARGEDVVEDTSRRLKTKPKFMQDINESRGSTPANGSGANTPSNGTPKLSAKKDGAILPHLARLQAQQNNKDKNGIPTFHRPLMDDDIIGALDLDIDVEID